MSSEQIDSLEAKKRDMLSCYEPGCILTLTFTAASVNVLVQLTIPDDTSSATGADPDAITANAHALIAQEPAALTTSLGVDGITVASVSSSVNVQTGVLVHVTTTVLPPPMSPTAGAATEGEGMPIGCCRGGRRAAVVLVITVVLYRRKLRQQGKLDASASKTAGHDSGRYKNAVASSTAEGESKLERLATEKAIERGEIRETEQQVVAAMGQDRTEKEKPPSSRPASNNASPKVSGRAPSGGGATPRISKPLASKHSRLASAHSQLLQSQLPPLQSHRDRRGRHATPRAPYL